MTQKFKKFEPMSALANQKIEELIRRGGIIVQEQRGHVLIKRLESVAKIDQFGRVDWGPELPMGK